MSHYLLDAIPHRDYELTSVIKDGEGHNARVIGIDNKKVLHDFTRVFVDGIVGVVVLFFMARPELTFFSLLPFIAITIGAVLPDALQPAFWLWQKFPMTYIHRFHTWIHTSHEPRPMIGFSIQGILIAISLFVLSL
ncbi:MAG: hypothetical protein HY445_03735 [Candidatus Niyogibacteria bacterium]|nr:hypothetical protein [Candidatus Niyogibacteria bacterium]